MLPKLEPMVLEHVKRETGLARPVQFHEEYIHEQEEKALHCKSRLESWIVPPELFSVKYHQWNHDQYEHYPEKVLLSPLYSANPHFLLCVDEPNDFKFFYAKHSLELNKVSQDGGLFNAFPDEGEKKHLLYCLNKVCQNQCSTDWCCP